LRAFKADITSPARLLFHDAGRNFWETLYLKLSFLGELCRRLLSGQDRPSTSEWGPSVEGIWVKLCDQNSLLPRLWGCKPVFLQVGEGGLGGVPFPGQPRVASLQFLGMLWFYALLTNHRQDVATVYKALKRIFETPKMPAQSVPGTNAALFSDAVFDVSNIFWNPEGQSLVGEDRHVWDAVLSLGWSLLESCRAGSFDGLFPQFWQTFDQLRSGIQARLFGSAQTPAKIEPAEADGAIADILSKLIDKWAFQKVSAPAVPGADGALEKTKLVSGSGRPPQPEEIEPTVLISAAETEPGRGPAEETTEPVKTVVLSSPGHTPDSGGVQNGGSIGDAEQDIPETVIVSGGQPVGRPAVDAKRKPPKGKIDAIDAELDDTASNEDSKDGSGKDELLSETVILKPAKPKNDE
jgi:hypothetical protein